MKVSISKPHDLRNRGHHNFKRRLFDVLISKYDVRLVENHADIHLGMPGEICSKGKNIVRVDGVYYDKERISWNNKIRKSIAAASGVIYQSRWSQTFAETMLNVRNKKSKVIYNGADPQSYQIKEIDKRGFDKVFIVCAHWRPNKRLQAITEVFISLCKDRNIGLYVVGKPDWKTDNPHVVYFGELSPDKLYPIYASSDYFVHICHLDACPNSVIEALVCGLPIVSNNIGGTPEITGDSGVIVSIDKAFDFKQVQDMNAVGSRIVDRNVLAAGMTSMLSREWEVYRPEFFIDTVAKQYYDFFVEIVNV